MLYKLYNYSIKILDASLQSVFWLSHEKDSVVRLASTLISHQSTIV